MIPAVPVLGETPALNRSKWWLVALLGSGLALDYLTRLALFSVLPLWRKDLAADDFTLGLIASSFLWVYGLLSPVAGLIGDRFSRRTVIIASLAAWSTVALFSGLVTSGWQMVVLRILMAVAQVAYMPVGQALIADFHTGETRGRASGFFQAGSSFGVFLSGFPVAWLAGRLGWRGMLISVGVLGLAFVLILLRWLPDSPGKRSSEARVSVRETLGLLRIPSMHVLMLTFAMTSISYWVLFTYLPLFVYEQYHLTLAAAAFQATFYIQVANVALMPVYATVSDRLTNRDARNRYLACAATSALGLPALFAIGAGHATAILTGGLILFGLVMASADASWLAMLCNVTAPRQRSSAYGLLNFSGTLAGGCAAMLTAIGMKKFGLSAIIVSLSGMYLLIAGLILVCGYVLLGRDARNSREQEEMHYTTPE